MSLSPLSLILPCGKGLVFPPRPPTVNLDEVVRDASERPRLPNIAPRVLHALQWHIQYAPII